MQLINDVKSTIAHHGLTRKGDKVLIAISGGPDSVFLLYALTRLRFDLGIRLHVAHINHGLRRGADTDQKFVEKLSRKMGLPISSVVLKPYRLRDNGSIEESARTERYRALRTIARKTKAASVAVGHTQDDLSETVLMRVIRGSGLLGMQAILPSRKIGGVRIIRPLLEIKRKDVRSFLKKRKIAFRADPTNTNKKFFRNKVRLELLPMLTRHYNPAITESLAHLSENVTTDYDYLYSQARRVFSKVASQNRHAGTVGLSRRKIDGLHPALRRMVVRMAVEIIQGDTRRITWQHIKEVEDLLIHRPEGAVVDLPNRLFACKKQSVLIIGRRKT